MAPEQKVIQIAPKKKKNHTHAKKELIPKLLKIHLCKVEQTQIKACQM